LFEGRVEEVDICCEERFRSTRELLDFLGERFDLTEVSSGNASQRQRGGSKQEELTQRKESS
jgi:hypothetical protein